MSVIKHLYLIAFLFCFQNTFISNANENGNIQFSPERIIYLETNSKGVSTNLKNNTSRQTLVQAQVIPSDAKNGLPIINDTEKNNTFLITPPLHQLNIDESYNWRIQRVADGELATDRETTFYVALKVIPETSQQADEEPQFILAPTIYLKMLYRPKTIEELNLDTQVSKLQIRSNGNTLIVKNPTPLSMTFSSLKVGSYDLPIEKLNNSIPPFEEQIIELPSALSGEITWRVLNEYGLATKLEVRELDEQPHE
ncbi:fimbrial chaperone protein [Providencia heimbachae]|uniref:fimbrial biogenesis chaperone n=1 Tax=Providencia heimbachae TaxID=333962 RepID=UPI0010BED5FE|nr:fimbria/pilus periplasmic chaperone [Providencia heimbachae]QCJ69370.1 fimbrial chaperone protein [Providencia heimbachae]